MQISPSQNLNCLGKVTLTYPVFFHKNNDKRKKVKLTLLAQSNSNIICSTKTFSRTWGH